MKIEIKEQNYKHLVQCVYLGNLVINEYRKEADSKKEYSDFLDSLLTQLVDTAPKSKSKIKLERMPYEKTRDNLIADIRDRIEDSIKDFYNEYKLQMFLEMIAERFAANKNLASESQVDEFGNVYLKICKLS